MSINRILAAFVFVIGISSLAFAQGPGQQPKPQATPLPQPAPQVRKIAVVFSQDLQDPKTGIARFSALVNSLNREFQPRQTALDTDVKTIKALEDEINKLQNQPNADPKLVQSKIDQHDQMKKAYDRKGEDAQTAYQKRRAELLGPLQDQVGKALEEYAKAHGIAIIFDGNQVSGIVFALDGVDITKAFIADYNSKNPATAAATPPKP